MARGRPRPRRGRGGGGGRRRPRPGARARDAAAALAAPAAPAAPEGAVGLARLARGEHVVEREGGACETLVPDLEARLVAAAERAAGEALRARALDGGGDPAHEVAQQRAALEAARALARGRGAVERARVALWTRPPLVLASSWVVDAARLPEALRAEVEACDPPPAEDERLPGRAVDTRRLPADLARRVVAALGPLEAARSGLLVEGDNARALRLLAPRLRGEVQCAYLDPPFNTASDGFAYADRLPSHLWLAALDERLGLVAPLLRPDGALFAHIDGHEKERLRLLLDERLHHVTEVIWRIGWVSGFKSRANKFIRNHDTIYHYGRSPRPLFLKQHLPYPAGYVRRDGKPPRGEGYPLEDTWNCSAVDRLDSIQLKSFSREKVGDPGLTQKNEDLLERVLLTSSRPGDLVLDPYAGSGTTAAVAHKTGRRWVTIERAAALEAHARPRLARVVAGCPRGVSARHGWRGGGAFQTLRLESADQALAALLAPGARAAPGQVAFRLEDGRPRLDPAVWEDPLGAWLGPERVAVDLPETFAWLAGLRVERVEDVAAGRLTVGADAAGPVVVAWRRPGAALDEVLRPVEGASRTPGVLFVHGAGAPGRRWGRWAVRRLEAALDDLLALSAR
ncbi:MAG: site-specific DNA-methyltransferase [Planctomycetes bacterium]|nr:site-specific DNA-methyltransferase [Planctomycetota bacterium]